MGSGRTRRGAGGSCPLDGADHALFGGRRVATGRLRAIDPAGDGYVKAERCGPPTPIASVDGVR